MTVGISQMVKIVRVCIAPLLGALLMAGCLSAERSWDYRVNNPIVVSKETVSLVVSMPPGRYGLSGEDRVRLNRFLRDYIRRGRGVLKINVAPIPGDDHLTKERNDQIRQLLRRAGMRAKEFDIVVGQTSDMDGVFLAYGAHRASVPSCTDIAWGPTFDGSNYPINSFGCAYQKALGATIADPGDIVKAKDSGGKPVHRDVDIIRRHRAGQPTGATKSAEQGAVGFGNTNTTN
jgi:pilus assembly protein CpaD